MVGRIGYKVWKDRVRTAMFGRIGPEFHCLQGEGQNSNV